MKTLKLILFNILNFMFCVLGVCLVGSGKFAIGIWVVIVSIGIVYLINFHREKELNSQSNEETKK
jgi:hypothetical protein